MTPLPAHPVQIATQDAPRDKKDIDPLIFHQTDTPFLPEGWADAACDGESVLAFLMQLYAYFFAAFSKDLRSGEAELLGGTDILKARLLTSGPYVLAIYKTNFRIYIFPSPSAHSDRT